MKTKTKSYIFLLALNMLININFVYPQMFSDNSNSTGVEAKDMYVKDFLARYYDDSVYLKIIINGLEKNAVFNVERSLDGNNFEEIGSFVQYGTIVNIDIMNSYIDKNPSNLKTYYRLSRYDIEGNKFTSEIACVFPENNKAPQSLPELSEKNK
jgi:hypothetical protein